MSRWVSSFRATLVLLSVFAVCGISSGDESVPVLLTLHPMAAPVPALKYQLLPPFAIRSPGNAAVHYGKATSEETTVFGNDDLLLKIEEWRDLPLDELRKQKINLPTQTIEETLWRAARCESCDWQFPVREEMYYLIRLPELQELRHCARILATRARLQIAKGQFEESLQTLQSGMALARHIAEGETIVNGLVGNAISSYMADQMFELVQQPGAPSLYWALSTLPRPFIDLRRGIEAELHAFQTIPAVRDLQVSKTPDEWRQSLLGFWQDVFLVYEGVESAKGDSVVSLMAASLKEYPLAREALIRRGLSADVVDAMPKQQVVLTNIVQTFEEARDNSLKWWFLFDSGVESQSLKMLEASSLSDEQQRILGPLAEMVPSWRESLWRSTAKMERPLAVLRVVEALRIHAAGHEGRLPEALSDITEVAIPDDPFTRKPFDYRLEGDRAILQTTPIKGQDQPTVYEIRVSQP